MNKNSKVVKGTRVVGTVEEIRSYGPILTFAEGSGLLHVTRLAGGSRPSRDRKLGGLAPGKTLEVDVLDVKDGKVTLSELWRDEAVLASLKVGSELKASVVHKLDCALIVAIDAGVAEGYDGFVHVSELTGDRKARDLRLGFAKLGDSLTLSVLSVSRDAKGDLSIKLSESQVELRRKLATSFAVGTTHTGDVVRRTRDGFVVSFGEFSGLLPEKELAGTGAGSIRVGGRVKSKVLAVGEDLSVTLTRKGL